MTPPKVPCPPQRYGISCDLKNFFYLSLYFTCLLLAILHIPKSLYDHVEERMALMSFGFIGVWRYSWWMTHVVRSTIYSKFVFPKRRQKADTLWASGWRPKRLLFMMTTFKELPTTTARVLQSILDECHDVGVPVILYIGTGTDDDEKVIQAFFHQRKVSIPFEVVTVRQKLPGKRFAIGETLRAMIRQGMHEEDPVIFMDGDTYFEPGCLRKCLPFLPLFPKMQALTTNETSIVKNGPSWLQKWLDMRFAQRDMTMRSYSLSDKILTLTGRMSLFRGKHLMNPEFIHIIEHDRLTHWLWGEYRFLSGDDKSTWYFLLKEHADMHYIYDATTTTIEYIHGSPSNRMKENLRRWSGNTLRNGARAIALGPRTVGYFLWWCLIDQRLSMWTMFIGHMITVVLTLTVSSGFLFLSFIWIGISRFFSSIILFLYARRIDMSFPFILYVNQILGTLIKIYILFRLPQQRWSNRGNQSAGFARQRGLTLRGWVATYLTGFYCTICFLFILVYLGLVSLPTWSDWAVMVSGT